MSGGERPAAGQTMTRAPLAKLALEEGLRPLAVAVMVTCIAISLGQLASSLGAAPLRGFWTWLAFGVAIESIHAYRLLERRSVAASDRARFRFVEWVVILTVVRMAPYLSHAPGQLAADVAEWIVDASTFVSVEFVLHSALAVLCWTMAYQLARALRELETTPIEHAVPITAPDFYLRSTMPHQGRTDRRARVQRIVAVVFVGALIMLLLSGVAQVDVRDLMAFRHGRSSGIIVNVLVYLVIGFFLISQAQYATLKASWELQGVPVLAPVARRWLLWLVVFLLLVGLLAALLPVSYSVGLLDMIYTAMHWVAFIVAQIAFLLLWALSALIMLVTNLFAPNDAVEAPPIAMPTPPPTPTGVEAAGLAWWQYARSALFWGILAIVLAYSLVHYVRDRWGLFRNLSLRRWMLRLLGMWDGLTQGSRRAAASLRARLRRRRKGRAAEIPAWRYTSPMRMTPRERVRFYYLATVRRSGQQGLPRPPAATPYEFERALGQALPEAREEVRTLTAAFVRARYSAHSVSQADAGGALAVWRRVKSALTVRRRARAKNAKDLRHG